MIVEKKIHKGYEEFEQARKKGIKISQLFYKYQYIYSSDKGRISLIFLKAHYGCWEIYCQKGKLFEDCERFATKKEAVKRIKELLE